MSEFIKFPQNKPKPNRSEFYDKSTFPKRLELPGKGKILTHGETVHNLAISQRYEEIVEAIKSGKNFIIATPTGSGKTSLLNTLILQGLLTAGEVGATKDSQALSVVPLRTLTDNAQETALAQSPLSKHLPFARTNPDAGYPPIEIFEDVDNSGQPIGNFYTKFAKITYIAGEKAGQHEYVVWEEGMKAPPNAKIEVEEFDLEGKDITDLIHREIYQDYDRKGNIVGLQYRDDTIIDFKNIRQLTRETRVSLHRRNKSTIDYSKEGEILNPVTVVTDGMAVNYALRDPLLWSRKEGGRRISTVVFDELDRGNLFQIQFLMHCIWLQKSGLREQLDYPPLQIIVTSATADSDLLIDYLNSETVINLPLSERVNDPVRRTTTEEDFKRFNVTPKVGRPSFDKTGLIIEKMRNQMVGTTEHEASVREGEGIAIFLPRIAEVDELALYLDNHQDTLDLPYKLDVRPYHSQIENDILTEYRTKPAKEGRVVVLIATDAAANGITTRYVLTGGIIDPQVIRANYDEESGVTKFLAEPMSQSLLTQEVGRMGRTDANIPLGREIYADVLIDDISKLPQRETNTLLRTNLDVLILSVLASFQQIKEKIKSRGIDIDPGLFDIAKYPFPVKIDQNRIQLQINHLKSIGALDENDRVTELGMFLKQLGYSTNAGAMIYEAAQEKLGYEALVIGSLLTEGKNIWRYESNTWKQSFERWFADRSFAHASDLHNIVSEKIFEKYTQTNSQNDPFIFQAAIIQKEMIRLRADRYHGSFNSKNQEKIENLEKELDEVTEKAYNAIFERRRVMKTQGVEAAILFTEKQRLEQMLEVCEFAKKKGFTVMNFYDELVEQTQERIKNLQTQIDEVASGYPVSDWISTLDVVSYTKLLDDREYEDFIRIFGLSKKQLEDIDTSRRERLVDLLEIRDNAKKNREVVGLSEESLLEKILKDVENEPDYKKGSIRTRNLIDAENRLIKAMLHGYVSKMYSLQSNDTYKPVDGRSLEKPLILDSKSILYGQSPNLCFIGIVADTGSKRVYGSIAHPITLSKILQTKSPLFEFTATNSVGTYDPETGFVKVGYYVYFKKGGDRNYLGTAEQDEFKPEYATAKLANLFTFTHIERKSFDFEKPLEEIERRFNLLQDKSNNQIEGIFSSLLQKKLYDLFSTNNITKFSNLEEYLEKGNEIKYSITDFIPDENLIKRLDEQFPDFVKIAGQSFPVTYKSESSYGTVNHIQRLDFTLENIKQLHDAGASFEGFEKSEEFPKTTRLYVTTSDGSQFWNSNWAGIVESAKETYARKAIFEALKHGKDTKSAIVSGESSERGWDLILDGVPEIKERVIAKNEFDDSDIIGYDVLFCSGDNCYIRTYAELDEAQRYYKITLDLLENKLKNEESETFEKYRQDYLDRSETLEIDWLKDEIPAPKKEIKTNFLKTAPEREVNIWEGVTLSGENIRFDIFATEQEANRAYNKVKEVQDKKVGEFIKARIEEFEQAHPQETYSITMDSELPEIEKVEVAKNPLNSETIYLYKGCYLEDNRNEITSYYFETKEEVQKYLQIIAQRIDQLKIRDQIKNLLGSGIKEKIESIDESVLSRYEKEEFLNGVWYLLELDDPENGNLIQAQRLKKEIEDALGTNQEVENRRETAKQKIKEFIAKCKPGGEYKLRPFYYPYEINFEGFREEYSSYSTPVIYELRTESDQILARCTIESTYTASINADRQYRVVFDTWDEDHYRNKDLYWDGKSELGNLQIVEENGLLSLFEKYEQKPLNLAFRKGENSLEGYWVSKNGTTFYLLENPENITIQTGFNYPVVVTGSHPTNRNPIVTIVKEAMNQKQKTKAKPVESGNSEKSTQGGNQASQVSSDLADQLERLKNSRFVKDSNKNKGGKRR